MWLPVFPALFERVAENLLLSVDLSATQLPAILLAILLDVDVLFKAYTWQTVIYVKFYKTKTRYLFQDRPVASLVLGGGSAEGV